MERDELLARQLQQQMDLEDAGGNNAAPERPLTAAETLARSAS